MMPAGWVFMLGCWGVILGLTCFSFGRILGGKSGSKRS